MMNNLSACYIKNRISKGFPGGTVDENPPANIGDTGSIPGLGRSHTLQSKSLCPNY